MKKILIAFLVIEILSFASCCSDDHIIVGGGSLIVYDADFINQIDTINTNFFLFNGADIELASTFGPEFHVRGLLATTCGISIINGIVDESIQLSLSRDMDYEGVIISAGDDILSNTNLSAEIDNYTIRIEADEDFMNVAAFQQGMHEFDLRYETSDGQKFSVTKDVYFNF